MRLDVRLFCIATPIGIRYISELINVVKGISSLHKKN